MHRHSVKNIHNIEGKDHNNLFLGAVYCLEASNSTQTWKANLTLNNKDVNFLLDSGADTNIISVYTFNTLDIPSQSLQKVSTNCLHSVVKSFPP